VTTEGGYDRLQRFDDVDATGEEAMFFAFLDRIEGLTDVVRRRERSYELLALRPGITAVDVGCGVGTAARDLEKRLEPGGSAHGIDLSAAMIAEAKRRGTRAGLACHFHCASAEQLPFEAGSVHAYRAERLYQHLTNPQAVLGEAFRVLAPGGRIVLIDQDWDLAILDSVNLEIARMVQRAFSNSLVNGTIGRQFRRLLLDAGFGEVSIEADTVAVSDAHQYGFVVDIMKRAALGGGVDSALVESWSADQHQRIEQDRFFMSMTHFLASATRP